MIARSMLLALSLGMFSVAPLSSSFLPPQYLPVYGGAGGTSFTRSCGAGKVLTGLRYRGGVLVDAVGILCRSVQSNGTLGSESTVGTLAGGGGGTSGSFSCGPGKVMTGAGIWHGSFVNGVRFACQVWNASDRKFGGTQQNAGQTAGTETGAVNSESCEVATQPMSGIRGRAHSLVDAIGFICNEP